jgi:hypothetical protein
MSRDVPDQPGGLALLVDLSEEIDAAMAEAVSACALMATPWQRLATGSALPGRPHSSAGAPVSAELLRRARRWRELGTHPPPGDNAGMAGDDGRAKVQLDEDTLGRRRVLGEDHPDTLASADSLATSLRGVGGYPGALAEHRAG